jgi:hypothetical protein
MRQQSPLGRPGRFGLWTQVRFHPQVLVWLATWGVAFLPAREAIPAWIYWYYAPTYRQVDFVMGVAEENSGSPLVRGQLEPLGEEWVMGLRATPAGYVLDSDPAIAHAPGRRIRVWWSDAAPVVGYRGHSTKIMPTSAFSRVPGLLAALGWTGAVLLTFVAGLWVLARLGLGTRVRSTETLLDEKGESQKRD